MNDAGIKHSIIDHGTKDYIPFKGGAQTKFQNHHWVQVKLHSPIDMKEETVIPKKSLAESAAKLISQQSELSEMGNHKITEAKAPAKKQGLAPLKVKPLTLMHAGPTAYFI